MKSKYIYISFIIKGFALIILIVLFFNIYLKNNNQIKIGLILPLTGGTSNGKELLKDKDINRHLLEEYLYQGFVHTGIFGTVIVKKGMHDFSIDLYLIKVENGKIIYNL